MEPFDTALLLLRVMFGAMFVAHGVNHIFGGGKIEGTGRWFTSIGFRHGRTQAWIASLTEIGAGALLVLGLFTPLAAAGLVGPMLVAIITVHARNGFFIIKEGWEYAACIIVAAIAMGLLGAGAYSLDAAFGLDETLSGWLGGAIAVGGGVVALLQLAVFWRRPARSEG
jgi:putative oxidoreductase